MLLIQFVVAVVIAVVLRLGIPLDIGIIGFLLRDGEGQLAAGIDLTEEDICQSTAAFHTGIVGKEYGLYLILLVMS